MCGAHPLRDTLTRDMRRAVAACVAHLALQEDLALVVNSLAARQDQLAEAITQLTAAVQSLGADKQQQQHQYPLAGVSTIPWI